MRILRIWTFIICLCLLPSSLSAEKVSLSTYYPAPFGAYDRLKLVPRDSLPLDKHCHKDNDIGTMYYDNGLNKLKVGIYVCLKRSTGEYMWAPMSLSEESDAKKYEITSGKVVCVKEDGTLGGCMANASFDGTCACQ